MKGFSLKTESNNIYAALKTGSVGIIISNKNGDLNISLSGMDAQNIYYVWYNNKLCIGDSIIIKYDDIQESMISEPICICDVNNIKSEEQLLLDSYYKLRQELLNEGLIVP